MGWSVNGKRVAVATTRGDGTYAEYCIADANSCVPIPDDISFDHAACTFVNPLTVIAMLETV